MTCHITMQTIPSPPLQPTLPPTLTAAQRNFLALHIHHVVTSWQWHFRETNLRATTDRGRTATIWRDELEHLVVLGLMVRAHGVSMAVTELGKATCKEGERV